MQNRGFPNNPGRYLAEEIASAKEFATKHNQEELFGFAHFYFSEIEMIDWKKEYGISLIDSDWNKLFELTAKFKELKEISSAQIRFTFWYNW